MTLKEFLRLLRRNWLLLLVVPLLTAGAVFFFSSKDVSEYASDTTIYTGIASTYNIGKSNPGSDYANNKAYSNLLSLITARATKQEVALRLLARHLALKRYDSTVLSPETYNRLKTLVDEPLRQQLVGPSLQETTSRLTAYLKSSNQNVIYKILNSGVPSYSFAALDKIASSQVGSSDLVKVDYVSDDAAVCKQTLLDLTDVFIRKHRELQEGQNESVIDYFSTETAKARRRLDAAEKNLLAFQRTNNLINYNEQAETITSQKEGFEQQINELELQYAGAVSTLKTLDKALKNQGISNLNSQEIYHLNNELVELNTQIANADVFSKGKARTAGSTTKQALKDQAEQVERQMQRSINKYTTSSQPDQGISAKSLATNWIAAMTLVDELKAKLLVMRQQQHSFGQEYQKIAPLGAEMRKIERERELAEKEYLAVLNNLDQSRVAQQNIELTSHLKVVDPPYLATNRAKSKRLLLILFGALSTWMMTVGALTAVALLDQSLRNTVLASTKTGFPVLGMLPQETKEDSRNPLFENAECQLARQLLLKMQQLPSAPPPCLIGVVSSHPGEGKSVIVNSLAKQLNALGVKTLLLMPRDHSAQYPTNGTTGLYSPLQGLNPETTFSELAGISLSDFAVVIIEFPALLKATYPVVLLKHLNLLLVAVKATRTWQLADKNLFENIQKVTSAPIEIVLNEVSIAYAEEILGKEAKLTTVAIEPLSITPQKEWEPRQAAVQI